MSERPPADFDADLARSKSALRLESDSDTICRLLPGVVSVLKTPPELDTQGIDYVATLRRGREVFIDVKSREAGSARWWAERKTAEVALEIYSVMPGGRFNLPAHRLKTGWTLCEKNRAELILFTFDPKDCPTAYLVSLQLLRTAFHRELRSWAGDAEAGIKARYKVAVQVNRSWESQCVFVPIDAVLAAIETHSRRFVAAPPPAHAPSGLDWGARQRLISNARRMREWHAQNFVPPSADVTSEEDGGEPP